MMVIELILIDKVEEYGFLSAVVGLQSIAGAKRVVIVISNNCNIVTVLFIERNTQFKIAVETFIFDA